MPNKQGIDISQHQGSVDFKKVKSAGYDFVICKTSEGQDFVDPTWSASRVLAIHSNGLKLGVYHFLRPRPGRSGAVEARHAVQTATEGGWGRPGDLKLAADIEVSALPNGEPTHTYLRQFVLEVVRLTGHKPMIYTFPSFWNTQMAGRPNLHCPLWIAHFGVQNPSVPKAWDGKFVIHQFSSDGQVPGVNGRVDLNRASGPLPLIPKKVQPKPDPKPDPKPEPPVKVDMKSFQATINRFVGKWLEDVPPLIVDGDRGQMTDRYIKMVKHYLGYGKSDVTITRTLIRRMRHPLSLRYTPPGMIARAVTRRRKQHIQARKERKRIRESGVAEYDGKPVPLWMVEWLDKARGHRGKTGAWRGVVVSGIRTRAHSIELCMAMCGAPSCPGKCAGASSNHNADPPVRFDRGAVDVSDYIRFGEIMRELGAPLKNDLPLDRVHFSHSGH